MNDAPPKKRSWLSVFKRSQEHAEPQPEVAEDEHDFSDTNWQFGSLVWKTEGSPSELAQASRLRGKPREVGRSLLYSAKSPAKIEVPPSTIDHLPREVHFVNRIGSFLDAEDKPIKEILAVPANQEGCALIVSKALDDRDRLEAAFEYIATWEGNFAASQAASQEAQWTIDNEVVDRFGDQREFRPPTDNAPYGTWNGLKLCGNNRPVEKNSVLAFSPAREIVQVDDEVLSGISGKIALPNLVGMELVETVLAQVIRLVRQALCRNEESSHRQLLMESRLAPDGLVPLSLFVRSQIGLAEHQALMAGLLLNHLSTTHRFPGRAE